MTKKYSLEHYPSIEGYSPNVVIKTLQIALELHNLLGAKAPKLHNQIVVTAVSNLQASYNASQEKIGGNGSEVKATDLAKTYAESLINQTTNQDIVDEMLDAFRTVQQLKVH